jgi:hypothetical protein
MFLTSFSPADFPQGVGLNKDVFIGATSQPKIKNITVNVTYLDRLAQLKSRKKRRKQVF